jgi:hypothetical protein
MPWYNRIFGSKDRLTEDIQAFVNRGKSGEESRKEIINKSGEGVEDIYAGGYGQYNVSGFNRFFNRYFNKFFDSEYQKILDYRRMASSPEVADVIEDAVNESTDEDENGDVIKLEIKDPKLLKNENIKTIIYNEFTELFFNRVNITEKLWDMLRSYYIDGRVYYERLINIQSPKDGIMGIKKLPAETIDFVYDPKTGKPLKYYQYLTPNAKRPFSEEEAKKMKNIIIFNPEQIGAIDYGVYGRTKQEIYGYLEKGRVAYNQLKLLETSVIIYRIVRSPERFVFKIDTGNMPKDKAMKFVEKIKNRYIKKQTYDPATGALTHEPEVLNLLENFWIPISADGRGSDITTIGGNAAGFKELDDLYYFARKLYRALKYPLSRISNQQEGRENEISIGGGKGNEIARDEVKWAKFLERHQSRFCRELMELFLLHMEFKGLKKQYDLNKDKLKITMTAPSHYKEAMHQSFLEMQIQNYNSFSNNAEFSKTFLIKRYLKFTDEELQENLKGFDEDLKYFPNLAQAGMEQGGEGEIPGEGGSEGEPEAPPEDAGTKSTEEQF